MGRSARERVVILGTGFAGWGLARELERLKAVGPGGVYDVSLVGPLPACVLTPLLFEVAADRIAPAHASNPVASSLLRTAYEPGTVTAIDLERRRVRVAPGPRGRDRTLAFDTLVLALGGVARRPAIPGVAHALAFKTLDDAIALRDRLRRLAYEIRRMSPGRARDAALSVVVVGGGLVGSELAGELASCFPRFLREAGVPLRLQPRLTLLEAGPGILGELAPSLAATSARLLADRGVAVAVDMPVAAIEPGGVVLADGGFLPAATVVLATGVAPNPLLATLDLPQDASGRVIVDAAMHVIDRSGVWALGDCAAVPAPSGGTCAPLAQHASRQAERLAANLLATAHGHRLWPYAHEAHGVMASLGPQLAVGQLLGWRAWGSWVSWLRSGYYAWDLATPETRRGLIGDHLAAWLRSPWPEVLAPGGLLPPAHEPATAALRVTFAPATPEAAGEEGSRERPRDAGN